MSKTIATILSLKDQMSPKLIKVSKNVDGMSRDMKRASQQAANMANKFTSSVNRMVGKAAKLTAIGVGAVGALGIKTGLSEAFNLEGYRMQLETATKDTQKAADIMKYSIQLANKTPFEGGELVEGAAKFEAMGMSAKKWLPLVGDMAASTNKSFDQAVEALIDAQTGELERLKEFGITKAKIAEQGEKMFGKALVNNKGQITDMAKFNEAIVALMEERFSGGMEKQANTVKGLWSTITGVTKSSLAKMLGMQKDGTIKAGSLLEKVKEKVKSLADKLTQWQNDGTIDRIGQKFSDVFTTVYNTVEKAYNFIKDNDHIIIAIGAFALSLSVLTKAVLFAKTAFSALQVILAIFNGTLALSPIGATIIAVSALAAGLAVLITHWEDIVSWIKKAWEWLCKWNGENAKEGLAGTTEEYRRVLPKSSLSLGGKALGTSYWKGGLTHINERGGEIVDLPNGSRVIPADKSQRMMNSSSNNIVININGTNKSTSEIMGELVPQLKLAMANI